MLKFIGDHLQSKCIIQSLDEIKESLINSMENRKREKKH